MGRICFFENLNVHEKSNCKSNRHGIEMEQSADVIENI